MDNPLFFMALFFGGGVFLSFLAIACHRLSTRLIRQGWHFSVRLFVPLLLTGTVFVLPIVLMVLYSSFYGYKYEADETPGPMMDASTALMMLLWPYGICLLIIYAVAAFLRRRDRPARARHQ